MIANQFELAAEELAKSQLNELDKIKLETELVKARIEQVRKAIARRKSLQGLANLGLTEAVAEAETVDEPIMAELKQYTDDLAKLTEKLLEKDPDSIDRGSIAVICGNYINQGNAGRAKKIVKHG